MLVDEAIQTEFYGEAQSIIEQAVGEIMKL